MISLNLRNPIMYKNKDCNNIGANKNPKLNIYIIDEINKMFRLYQKNNP